jgi:hypothetical protein
MIKSLKFNLAAWLDVSSAPPSELCAMFIRRWELSLVSTREERWKAFESLGAVTGMNVIKVIFRVQPWALSVVYHKFHIRRYPFRLYWAQVDAEDSCAWIFIAH